MTVAAYEQELDTNLQDLGRRINTGRYWPQSVRRVHIPKGDGGQRPLGVPTLGDSNPCYRRESVLCSGGARVG